MSTKIDVAWLTKPRFVFGEGQKLKWCIHVSGKINVDGLPNIDLSLKRDKKLMLQQYIFKMMDTHIKINVHGLPNKDLSLKRDKKLILHQ